MLRMYQSRSAEGVKDYYTEALATGDYYLSAERHSPWRGKLAERLGLGPEVSREAFARMADNLHPLDPEEPLTPRTGDNRTVGYDINFHVPKSVSVMHMWNRDERIIEALRDSVRETMEEIERQAATRVRIGQQDGERHTGELVWGEFLHSTTRPVDGVPDPHLHVHCFTFNVTHDPVEGRLKAAHFRDIKRDAPYHEAAFYSRLTRKLEACGYAIERRGGTSRGGRDGVSKQWEIAGVLRSTLSKFSRRTAQIEREAAKRGITDPEQKSRIGALTRDAKAQSTLLPSQLRERWIGSLTAEEREALQRASSGQPRTLLRTAEQEAERADRVLEYAIRDRFSNQSVVSMPRLLESALRFGLGEVTPESVKLAASRHESLLAAREGTELLVTTREVLQEERALVKFAREGRGVCAPLERDRPWAERYRDGAAPSTLATLNADQENAVGHVLTSPDRVVLIRGGSGTGKTTLIKAAIGELEKRGIAVTALAPSSEASRGAMREAGISTAETVAAFLDSTQAQQRARGGVIWVDEAGQLGCKSMRQLIEVAAGMNARLIFSGDTRQHGPVERGDALRLIETRAGIRSAEVREIVRQRGLYKEAVAAIDAGKYVKAVQSLDKLGAIHEIGSREWDVISRDYVDTIRTGKTCMVVAPTHAEGEQIASVIRADLKQHGVLGQEEKTVERLRDLGWNDAQRGDAANYEAGQVVQMFRSLGKGKDKLKAGERLVVTGKGVDGRVMAEDRDGRVRSIPLAAPEAFGVSERLELGIAPGEKLRITGNGRTLDGTHRLNNGTVHRVAGFTPDGHVRLGNGWVVSRDFAQWDHGYVSTSNAAQGRSVHRVLVWQGWSGIGAGSLQQVYVSMSRGRESVGIYTDDREAMIEAMERRGERRLAVELVEGTNARPGMAMQRSGHQQEKMSRSVGVGVGDDAAPGVVASSSPAASGEASPAVLAARAAAQQSARLVAHAQELARLRVYEHTRSLIQRVAVGKSRGWGFGQGGQGGQGKGRQEQQGRGRER